MLQNLFNPTGAIIGALALGGTLMFTYSQGVEAGRGKVTKQALKLGENYVMLLSNEKIAHWSQIGQERRGHREQLEIVERYFEAGEAAKAKNRASLKAYTVQAEKAEKKATELLNQLEIERNEWATQRIPNDYVCGIYNGVFNIAGCSGGRAAGSTASGDTDDDASRSGGSAVDGEPDGEGDDGS